MSGTLYLRRRYQSCTSSKTASYYSYCLARERLAVAFALRRRIMMKDRLLRIEWFGWVAPNIGQTKAGQDQRER
jgi:hypothetical protein